MTPSARLQMAIEILERLEKTAQPADRFLKSWFRSRRFAGSKDRRAISDQLFRILRRRAHLAHRMQSDSPRAWMIASLMEAGEDVEALFRGGYGPAPLRQAERVAMMKAPQPAPNWVKAEYPLWLESELARAFGPELLKEMAAFIPRAFIDIRVNSLKAQRQAVMDALEEAGISCMPTPYALQGLRIEGDGSRLGDLAVYGAGAFEFQDEAAQIAAHLCAVRPGMRVLDLAAGAGGKSLAFAAAMQNCGEIVACDVRAHALAELERRARRAGVTIIKTVLLESAKPEGLFDAVFVDAPCSGTGTWRRQPELRWRLTSARLAELVRIQQGLLGQASGLVGPGGRLLYATCSILPVENQDQIGAFQARYKGYSPMNLWEKWSGKRPPGQGQDFRASPRRTGTDGFFCAGLGRE